MSPPMVGKGDSIHVRDTELDNDPITVEWQQWTVDRTERYIPAHYRATNGDGSGQIFIQVSKVDDFRRKHRRSEDLYTVQIDNTFQYGENKEHSKRFLVFHNKENKMWQHRFVKSLLTMTKDRAVEIAHRMGLDSFDYVSKNLVNYIGDPLREF